MKIAVFGAGAIGGHVAARLSLAGTPVSVVARGAHLAAIQARGLTLAIRDARQTVRITATDDASSLGVQDLAIVTVKRTALAAAVDGIRPLVGPNTRVVFLMNGLPPWFAEGLDFKPSPELATRLDPTGAVSMLTTRDRTVWGVITSGSAVEAPGVVRNTAPNVNTITLGYPDDHRDTVIDTLAEMLTRAGFSTTVAGSIRVAIWQKLLTNAAQAMVATVTNRNHLQVTSDPETRAVTIAMIKELVAIGERIGLAVDADPVAMTDPSRFGTHIPSFLQDLRMGRALEIDSTTLAARDIARVVGVPAPHLTTVAAIVAAQSADAVSNRSSAQDQHR